MSSHQDWLERQYQEGYDDDVNGETNINHCGLNIDVTIESGEVASFKIVGIENETEARMCADHAAHILGLEPPKTDAEVMDFISRAHLPHTIDATECVDAILADREIEADADEWL
jgi:hypothetical protein